MLHRIPLKRAYGRLVAPIGRPERSPRSFSLERDKWKVIFFFSVASHFCRSNFVPNRTEGTFFGRERKEDMVSVAPGSRPVPADRPPLGARPEGPSETPKRRAWSPRLGDFTEGKGAKKFNYGPWGPECATQNVILSTPRNFEFTPTRLTCFFDFFFGHLNQTKNARQIHNLHDWGDRTPRAIFPIAFLAKVATSQKSSNRFSKIVQNRSYTITISTKSRLW
jgi:hypothetical protein